MARCKLCPVVSEHQGSKLKKFSGCLLATNCRSIVARCKFLVASLYNVNDAAHSNKYGAMHQIESKASKMNNVLF